jgi:hypothetical protein
MLNLSPAEARIIRSMLVRQYGPKTEFLDQLAALQFDVRHLTGTGYYEIFVRPPQLKPADNINEEITENLTTSLAPPCDSVGFTLFIRGGYLSSFEGYTFGDVRWPDGLMEKWLVLDPA